MRTTPFIPIIPTIAGAAILLACAGSAVLIDCHKKDVSHAADGQTTIYHCPMHPNYLSHQPGNCPICGMKLVPVEGGPTPQKESGKGRVLFYRDAMNPSFTSKSPGKAPGGMDLVPVYESEDNGNSVKIDPAMIQSIGVQTEKAVVRTLTRDVRTSATVAPDERRITTITSKIMGYVEKLYVNYTGQRVKQGQPLYDLYSPDLVSAQSEYFQAYRNPVPGDSGHMLKSVRRRLLNWDVTDAQIADLEKRGEPEKTMTIASPADGIVTEKMIVDGQKIEPGMKLYTVVDYARVWVQGAVYQQDVPLVKIGQTGVVELDYYPGERFEGKVTYIAPEMNMESRTLVIRLELANTPDIKIKPGMNATLTIHSPLKAGVVTVPDQAVIHSGLRTIIVVAKGGGFFEPREIRIGQTAGGYTEVLEGVSDGEEIVVSSQFLIDSESNLKAAVMKMTGKQGT
jgi:membrane fusion protein, copper/silver efflux system